jgi:hypothetical protein
MDDILEAVRVAVTLVIFILLMLAVFCWGADWRPIL